jgi:molybdopterin-guanine dinucleotide biosynthesis protein A
MDRHVSMPIGVIVERVEIAGPWPSHAWRPAGIVIGGAPLPPGSRLRQGGSFFAGTAPLDLHRTDIASYRENLQQEVPRLYVVLAASEDGRPPGVHLVTAAPDEAGSYLDGEPTLVDGIPMPRPLIDLVVAYIAEHDSGVAADTEISARRFRRAMQEDRQ